MPRPMGLPGSLLAAVVAAWMAAPAAAQTLPDVFVTAPRLRPPREETVELPNYSDPGLAMPVRRAASNVSWALGSSRNLEGRPAYAAQVLLEMEFLSVDLFTRPMTFEARGILEIQFAAAKREWREALGIPLDTPTQTVIDAFFRILQGLRADQGQAAVAAAPPAIFTLGPDATWARLNSLGYLRESNEAAVDAWHVLRRMR